MAIFGKFNDLTPLFSKTQELEYLEAYISSILTSDFLPQISQLRKGENIQTKLEYGLLAITHCYALKSKEEAFFESHQKYIDLQIVIQGSERYLIGSKDHFTPKTSYDADKDLIQYSPTQEVSDVLLRSGEICILFPHDVHAAGIGIEKEIDQLVKKMVIKIPTHLIKHRL